MNIVGKSLAVAVMGLAATGAQATIKGGVTTASTELAFNLWNEASEISYALDLGIIHGDFLKTKTEEKSWSLDAKTSTAFAAFLNATQPDQTLVYNIASSNGLSNSVAALSNFGVLRTSNDEKIAAVTVASIGNTVAKINERANNLNGQLGVSGGDISNNFDSVSGKADVGYFGNTWGDNMDGSTAFGTVGLEGEGNSLGFYWQNRKFASLGLTGIEKLADWTFVIDFDTKTAALNYGAPAVIPVPAAVWLFGTGLMGLFAAKRRKGLTA